MKNKIPYALEFPPQWHCNNWSVLGLWNSKVLILLTNQLWYFYINKIPVPCVCINFKLAPCSKICTCIFGIHVHSNHIICDAVLFMMKTPGSYIHVHIIIIIHTTHMHTCVSLIEALRMIPLPSMMKVALGQIRFINFTTIYFK